MASPAKEHGVEQGCEWTFQRAGGARAQQGQPSQGRALQAALRGTRWAVRGSEAARECISQRDAGERLAARARPLRMCWPRTIHGRPPGQEERQRGLHALPLAGAAEMASQSVYEATFSPPCPSLQPHARPGGKADLHFGRWHAGRTPGKERAACADAEISILMQHNAENK